MKIKVGLVVHFRLFSEAFSDTVDSLVDFEIVLQARNGLDLQHQLEDNPNNIPDLMMIDADMPVIDGLETTEWLQKHHPSIKLIAIAKNDGERAIITMLKAGCCSYLVKSSLFEMMESGKLKKALQTVYTYGYFNPGKSQSLLKLIFGKPNKEETITLNEGEKQFLQLASTELSYEQILIEMNISQKIGNKYIDSLFRKFGVRSRMGLVLETRMNANFGRELTRIGTN